MSKLRFVIFLLGGLFGTVLTVNSMLNKQWALALLFAGLLILFFVYCVDGVPKAKKEEKTDNDERKSE